MKIKLDRKKKIKNDEITKRNQFYNHLKLKKIAIKRIRIKNQRLKKPRMKLKIIFILN
jgi:hypothetical protein